LNAPAAPRPALLATIFILNLIEFLQAAALGFSAAPTMGQINASPEEYSLIAALYASVAVLSISQMTVLVQRLGWRNYLLGSVLVFLIGTWICAGSTTPFGFAAGRVLMAAGGGGFMSASRMLINLIPPSPQRVKGIAVFGLALATGVAFGPWVAGILVGREAWSGLFLLLALLAVLGVIAALRCVPSNGATLDGVESRFHLGDGLALGAGAFLVLYSLQRLAYDWHGDRAQMLVPLVCGVVLTLGFLVGHGRRGEAFLRLEMLRSRRYLTGLSIFALCYGLLGVFNALVPHLLQRGLGIPFEQAGEMQTAGMSSAIAGIVVMLLIVRKSPHATKFYVAAFVLLAVFGWQFTRLDPSAPAWLSVVPRLALFGAFVTAAMLTTALHSFKDFQQDNLLFSHAQQFKNILGQVGQALGVGGTAVLLQERGAQHAARLAESASASAAVLAQQGNLLASLDVFWVICWIGVAGAVVLAMQKSFD
jgi:MFS transporter, DHA2 family, multidrug resistance protein